MYTSTIQRQRRVPLLLLLCALFVILRAHAVVAQNDLTKRKVVNAGDDLLQHGLLEMDQDDQNTATCRLGVHLEWTAQVGSGVYATPRIVDLHNDGKKEILIPTSTQFLEALDGATGEDAPGFPFGHPRFRTFASPLPVDIDGDGEMEWLVAMYTGELMVFNDDGRSRGAVKLPSLPMKKQWRQNNLTADAAVGWKPKPRVNNTFSPAERHLRYTVDMTPERIHQDPWNRSRRSTARTTLRRQTEVVDENGGDGGFDDFYDDDGDDDDDEIDKYYYDDDREPPLDVGERDSEVGIGPHGKLSPEAYASMDLLWHPELYKSSSRYAAERDLFDLKQLRSVTESIVNDDEILVDPHIMSTPVIVDVNSDGDLDVLVHVSYFFDQDYYKRSEKRSKLPEDIELADYVASALILLDLVTGEVKWLRVLDVSTQNDEQPAYALSSPLVINVNMDFLLEVFISSSSGKISAFTGRGDTLKGWPRYMGPITASCASEDVNGDGLVDICVGDVKGNVNCFNLAGSLLWSQVVTGAVTERVTFGDVNNDGVMDVVLGTSTGQVYALNGNTGKPLPFFPFHASGPISASPLLVNLNDTIQKDGLHIVLPSDDGSLYILSGTTGCYEMIDIDEKVSASVLADDLTGNGKLDLVVSTLSGKIMAFETDTTYHPLKAWPSKTKSINGATASEGYMGVFIHPRSRGPYDVRGDSFTLTFSIVDNRKSTESLKDRQYSVAIFIGPRVLVYQRRYKTPGTYTVMVRAPLERMYASVHLLMQVNSGQTFHDCIALSFNINFLETIKYSLVIPFILLVCALSFVKKKHEVPLEAYERYERFRY